MTTMSKTADFGLGSLLSEHGVTKTRRYGNLVGGLASVGLGLAILLVGAIAATADPRYLSICGSAGLIALAGGGWSIWTNRREKNLSVQLFQEGIVHAANGRSTTVRWDDVRQIVMHLVYNRKLKTTTHLYRLHDATGQKLTLHFSEGQLNDLPQLGQTIQQEVNGRLLPRAVAAVNSNQTVRFGKFSLSQAGIGYGKKQLPWAETAAVEMQRGVVTVWRQGKQLPWARAEILHVPNVFVFTTLAKQLLSRHHPAVAPGA